MPCSLPSPDCLTPPKGASMCTDEDELTDITPVSTARQFAALDRYQRAHTDP